MRKYIVLLIIFLLAGAAIIVIPLAVRAYNAKALADNITLSDQNTKDFINKIESDMDTIEEPELSFDELEPGIYDDNQMYFRNVEALYAKLKYNQVEQVKQEVQFFVHQNIGADIKECTIDSDSINSNGDEVSFSAIVSSYLMKVSFLDGNARMELSIKNKP